MSTTLSCQACGGPIENVSPVIRSISCPFCANLLYFDNSSWHSGGKFPTAIDAPPLLRVDRHANIAGNNFRVAGRVRLEYDSGHWDEWWLEFENGDDRWLEEDDGAYHFHQSVEMDATANAFASLSAGQMLQAGKDSWFITEAGSARVAGVEGQLPVTLQPGFELRYFDAVGGGKEVSIELWGNEVEASRSERINPANITWND